MNADPMDLIKIVTEDELPKAYIYQGTLCIEDGEPFDMAGVWVQPVIASEPIFRTEPRPNHPCIATRFGWVCRDELVEIDPAPWMSQLNEWLAAMREVSRLADLGLRADFFAAALEEQQLGQRVGDLMVGAVSS
jgi:hypothetical protein